MTGTCKLTRKRFPNLEFPDDRMAAVYDLLLELDHQGHPNASEIQKEFFARLEYLNDYGGAVSEDDDRRRFKVTLKPDMNPYSFGIVWEQLNAQTGEYSQSMFGCLQCNVVQAPWQSVQIGDPQWWSIHT